MDAPVAVDQLSELSAVHPRWLISCLCGKGGIGCARGKATCEILDATLAHSRSLGSDHAFVRLLHFLLFCFSCMLQPSTDLCAYTARGD